MRARPQPPGSAADPDLPGRSAPFVLAGVIVALLASALGMLAPPRGDVLVLGVALGAAAVVAAALVLVLVRRPRGDRARLALVSGLALVVAYAVLTAVLAGDVAMSGVVALAMVTGVSLGDTWWAAGFATASALAFGVTVPVTEPPGRWAVPLLVLVVAAGLVALLEAARRRALTELRRSRAEWERTRATDLTTGLASREGLALAGARMVEAARRQGDAVHCVFVEVAGLDAVTAELGPTVRDQAVAAVADALAGGIRGTDVAARWDSEVFCVVGPGVGVSPLELERRVHERLTDRPAVPVDVWSPHVTAAAATLPPWEDGNLNTLLSLGQQVMQVRRVLRGGYPRSRESDLPRPGLPD